MPVKLNSTGGGSVTLDVPNTASTYTLTLPAATATVATTTGTLTNPTINGFTGDTSVINVGSGQLYKDTSGNVGIGTTTPSGRLGVVSTSDGTVVRFQRSGGTNIPILNFNFTESSNVVELEQTGASAGSIAFKTGGSQRARITSDGRFLIGTTTAFGDGISAVIRGSGSNTTSYFYFNRADTANSGNVLVFTNNQVQVGVVSHTNTATTYATTSDYRLKENVQSMQNALATVAQLNPVTYTWKADGSDGQGFIAHELQAVVPDAVTGEKDAVDDDGKPLYQGVDTSFLVATLTKAIQEQQAQIEALTARIAQLEAK